VSACLAGCCGICISSACTLFFQSVLLVPSRTDTTPPAAGGIARAQLAVSSLTQWRLLFASCGPGDALLVCVGRGCSHRPAPVEGFLWDAVLLLLAQCALSACDMIDPCVSS